VAVIVRRWQAPHIDFAESDGRWTLSAWPVLASVWCYRLEIAGCVPETHPGCESSDLKYP